MKKIMMILALCSGIVLGSTQVSFSYEVISSVKEIEKLVAKDKIALVSFFASFCPLCKKEVPELNKIYKKHGKKIGIYGLSYDETKEPLDAFIKETKLSYPVYVATYDVAEELNMEAIPQLYIYKNGKLVKKIEGLVTYEELEKIIKSLQ